MIVVFVKRALDGFMNLYLKYCDECKILYHWLPHLYEWSEFYRCSSLTDDQRNERRFPHI